MIFRGMWLGNPDGINTRTVFSWRVLVGGNAASVWQEKPNMFQHLLTLSVALRNQGKGVGAGGSQFGANFPAHEGDLQYEGKPQVMNGPGGSQYLVSGPSFSCFVGYVGRQTLRVTATSGFAKDQQTITVATFAFPAFGNNFAAVTLTAMDQKPTAQSQRLLLTLVGKVENQNMGWNADRTSVGDQWGHGPTLAEGIPATVTLKTDGPRSVWALDGTGKHSQRVPAAYANGTLTFTVGPQYQTLWYAVEK